ncbi:MAG: hypothetical protein KGN32_05425 [Burkholderiales bacterium]|nr:hypothetical protein [Burkholderiales bacterium]
MNRNLWMRVAVLLAGAGLCIAVPAQALRDPTQPPPSAVAGPDGAPLSEVPFSEEGVAVVVRGGKPLLVHGTRLYGVGQMLGKFRIERISETEVWLRQGTELRKFPRFAGIQRRESRPAVDCAAVLKKPVRPSLSSSSTSPKAVPCAGAQP